VFLRSKNGGVDSFAIKIGGAIATF